MNTLIIYDNIGQIFSSPITGSYTTPQGELKFLEVEIPKGKVLKKIDTTVTPNVPIYEDIPLSDIDNLKQQVLDLQNYIIAKESSETTNL